MNYVKKQTSKLLEKKKIQEQTEHLPNASAN